MKTKYAQWLNLRKISIIESDSQIFNYETPCNSLDQNPARDQKKISTGSGTNLINYS